MGCQATAPGSDLLFCITGTTQHAPTAEPRAIAPTRLGPSRWHRWTLSCGTGRLVAVSQSPAPDAGPCIVLAMLCRNPQEWGDAVTLVFICLGKIYFTDL